MLGIQGLMVICTSGTTPTAYSYTNHASTLHTSLLIGYVKTAPPVSERRVSYSKIGTDVKMQIRFYKMQTIDATLGQLECRVWMRLWWTDARLSST